MTIPYETSTSGDSALNELQKALAKFGCQSFGTMIDAERGVTIVQFKHQGRVVQLEASWKGYATALLKSKKRIHYGSRRQKDEAKALAQAKISVCSILRDWIKGQVTAVECGVMSFEAVFMPHMLLANGQRLIDKVRTENLLPAPEKENGNIETT